MSGIKRLPDRYETARLDPRLERQQEHLQEMFKDAPEEFLRGLSGMPVEFYRASNRGPGRFIPAVLLSVERHRDAVIAELSVLPETPKGDWPTMAVKASLLRIAPGIHPTYQSYLAALRFASAMTATGADDTALRRADDMVERSFVAARRIFLVGYEGKRPEGASVSLGDLRAAELWGLK